MIEKLIVLEDIDPVIFYGVNNANIQLIKALYPKLRIVARGNVIKVLGDEEEMCAFEENITKLEKYCAEYNSLKEEVIIDIIKGNAPQAEQTGNVIVFSVTGKPIIPRSENQLKLVEGFAKNDMVFAIGPAGSGKTYTAIALAVNSRLPNVGDYVTTDDGLKGEVSSVNVLRQLVKVLVEVNDEKELREYQADQLKFKPKRRRDVKLTAEEMKELAALEDRGGKSKIDDTK